MASLAASEAAMISASQEDRATAFCFSQPQETTARQNRNTQPVVECLVAQLESVMPGTGFISPM
eukprot:3712487-Prymnesium_polylepis.1